MKRINIVFTGCLFLVAQQCIASDPVSLMNAATSNLAAMQSNLLAILGMPPAVNPITGVTGSQTSNPIPNQPTPGFVSSTYTNSTTLPIIVTLTADSVITEQEIDPGAIYTYWSNPTTKIAVGVHADLSGIFASCNPAASYALSIVDAQLELEQTAATGKTIINNSGWAVLLSFSLSNGQFEYTSLGSGHRYQPDNKAINVTVIPMISEKHNPAAALKSYTISNQAGVLMIQ